MQKVSSIIFRCLGVFVAVATICVAAVHTLPSAVAAQSSVWSFNMWCIEMEMLPSERCNERRPEDWTSYQQYISRTERFEQEMSEEERRQAEAQERMDRQSVNPGPRIP